MPQNEPQRVVKVTSDLWSDQVPFGDVTFCRRFTAILASGYELDIELVNGVFECVAIRNPNGIRDRLPLPTLIQEAVGWASSEAGATELKPLRKSDLVKADATYRRNRSRPGYGLTDDVYEATAVTVREAKAARQPTDTAVMQRFHLATHEAARSRIRRARARGFDC
jgi:hypothetical protein